MLDISCREHLSRLEHLRTSVTLRSYGQRDPINEYKTEGFELFQNLLYKLRESVTAHLIRVELVERKNNVQKEQNKENSADEKEKISTTSDPKTWGKVGRNEKCPCGSNKKYKHCHGKLH